MRARNPSRCMGATDAGSDRQTPGRAPQPHSGRALYLLEKPTAPPAGRPASSSMASPPDDKLAAIGKSASQEFCAFLCAGICGSFAENCGDYHFPR